MINPRRFKYRITFLFLSFLGLCVFALMQYYPIPTGENIEKLTIWNDPTTERLEEYAKRTQNNATSNNDVILLVSPRDTKESLQFEVLEETHAALPKDHSYIQLGELGELNTKVYDMYLKFVIHGTRKSFKVEETRIDPISQKNITGSAEIEPVQDLIRSTFTSFIDTLKKDENKDIKIEDKSKLENVELLEVVLKDGVVISSDATTIPFARLRTKFGNCEKYVSLNVDYDLNTKEYRFNDAKSYTEKLCTPQFTRVGNAFIARCSDCRYYPVNKSYGLPSNYTPNAVQVTSIPGIAYFLSDGMDDLNEMNQAAVGDGIYFQLNSGYRSYGLQASLFETYVQNEMARGISRGEAEAIANTYSARPGFSEHQLGTTLDIASTVCAGSISRTCNGNNVVWDWLKQNAYKYGFALSYPEGLESRTGYIYEPWHYRWIGKDLAAEYKSVEGTVTLQEFLFRKRKY